MSEPDPLPRTQPARTYPHPPDTRGGESTSAGGRDAALPDVPGYELLGVLGRGGMGVVYKARDRKLNRLVAVKTIVAGADTDRVALARFWAEAEAMAAVAHPHVAQVFELGEYGGVPFLAMEYLPGGSLAQWPGGRPMPPRAAARLVEQIARGVNAAHELGIVHRDLKPGNVLLDEGGAPKVTDFGLAKRDTRDDLTRTGAVMGTPAYMSPEQAGGKSKFVGPPADVWALGVILYEALTGRRPFEGDGAPEVLQKIVAAEPSSVRSISRGVPHDLATVAAKCLTKEPAGRYATAGELAADLRRFLDGRPVLARPVSALGRAKRWCRRNPVVTGLLVGLAVLLGAATWNWRDAVASAATALAARGEEEKAKEAALEAQKKEEEARKEAVRERDEAYRRRAEGLRNEALMAGERGDGARALLLLARAVEYAERGNDAARSAALRTHFDAWRLTMPAVTAVFTSEQPIHCVAISPDGRFALVGGGTEEIVNRVENPGAVAGSVRLWDLRTGKPASPVLRHPVPVSAVAFRAGGAWTLDDEGRARLWDATAGTARDDPLPPLPFPVAEAFADGPAHNRFAVTDLAGGVIVSAPGAARPVLPLLKHSSDPSDVRFSADGTRVATVYDPSGDAVVQLWDAKTGAAVGEPIAAPRGAMAITFHPAGPLVVACGDNRIRFYDSSTAAALPTVLAHDGAVRGVAVSADGKKVAGVGHGARLWALGGKDGLQPLTVTAISAEPWLTRVTFSPDGRRVAVAHPDNQRKDGRVLVYETATRERIGGALHTPAPAEQLLFAPDGRALLARTKSGVYQFALDAPTTFGRPRAADAPVRPAFAPTGDAVLIASGKAAAVFDPASGAPVGTELPLPGRAWRAAFRADGRQAVVSTYDSQLVVWDRASGSFGAPRRVPIKDPKDGFDFPDGLQIGPDGRVAASARSGRVWWWPERADDPRSVVDGQPWNDALALSPDGRLLLARAGRNEQAWRLWALDGDPARPHGPAITTHGPVDPNDVHIVSQAAWRPDGGQVALAFRDGRILLWEVPSARPEGVVATGRAGPTVRLAATPHAVVYTPDGTRLVCGTLDGTARTWDAATGRPLGALMRHSDACSCTAVSPDGRVVAFGTSSGALRLWELETGKALGGPRRHPEQINGVGFAAGGRKVTTVCNDGLGRTFDAPVPFAGTPAQLMRAAERHTGQALDEQDEPTTLSPAEWAARGEG